MPAPPKKPRQNKRQHDNWLRALGVGFVKSVVVPALVAVLVAFGTTWVMQPKIHINFNNDDPFVTPKESRLTYNNTSIALRVSSSITLNNASVRLLAISNRSTFEHPINLYVTPTFGWPLGSESFLPHRLGSSDYIILAFCTLDAKHQYHTSLFFNEFHGVDGPESKPIPELNMLRDIVPGTYYLRIELIVDGMAPRTQDLKMMVSRDACSEVSLISRGL